MPTIAASRQKIKAEDIRMAKIADNEWVVVNNAKGTVYSVTKTSHGYYHCSCPFMTRGSHVGTSGVCKHITLVCDGIREGKE